MKQKEVNHLLLADAGTDLNVYVELVDEQHPSRDELCRPIWFGQVSIGTQQGHVLRLHNTTALPLPFCWQQTDQPIMQGHLLH